MGKREEYYEKILGLLHQYDIRDLTMEQIADHLGITKRTLYNYFDDKRTMLKEVMNHHIGVSMAYIQSLGNNDKIDAVSTQAVLIDFTIKDSKGHSTKFARSVYEYYPEIFDYCDSLSRRMIQDYFMSNVEKGRREGLYRTDFDPEIISKLVFYVVDGFKHDLMKEDNNIDFKNAFIDVIFCILRGMVTPAGSDILERELKKYNK